MTDIEALLINSTRYCLGRRSYAVGEHCDILKRHWNQLSEKSKHVIMQDVEKALDRSELGMEQDRREWENLAKTLWRS